jgi:hypothetical protein
MKVYGQKETDSLCVDKLPANVRIVPICGAHHLSGDYKSVAQRIWQAADFGKKSEPMSHKTKTSKLSKPCKICGEVKSGMISAALVLPVIFDEICKSRPEITVVDMICTDDRNHFHFQYVQDLMIPERGELTALDRDVLESLHAHNLLTNDIATEFEKGATLGEAPADRDRVAAFCCSNNGSSWWKSSRFNWN